MQKCINRIILKVFRTKEMIVNLNEIRQIQYQSLDENKLITILSPSMKQDKSFIPVKGN